MINWSIWNKKINLYFGKKECYYFSLFILINYIKFLLFSLKIKVNNAKKLEISKKNMNNKIFVSFTNNNNLK